MFLIEHSIQENVKNENKAPYATIFSMAAYATNRKAHFDYDLLEKYETGIELIGTEVKSIRLGQATLEGARALIRGGEAYVVGMSIPPYQAGNTADDYDPLRTRRLLLSKREILSLEKQLATKGLTLIPISLYNKSSKIKVEIALARGKKKFDKRETIKKRDLDRDIRRNIKAR